MILSDRDIRFKVRRHGIVDPFREEHLQPSSLDLTLGPTAKRLQEGGLAPWVINPQQADRLLWDELVTLPHLVVASGGFVLAATNEYFRFPADLVGRLDGKSSLARLGLQIHSTAGFFDPGFEGTATLEIFNCAPAPIVLRGGMRIAQMSFHTLSSAAERSYGHPDLGSKYQGQHGPTTSRYHENRE